MLARNPSRRRHPVGVVVGAAALALALASPAGIADASSPIQATPPGPAAASTARAYPKTRADTRAALATLMADPAVSSITVALVDDGRVVWQEIVGDADHVAGTTPTAATLYGIGSVSKVVTTAAVMTLVDRGAVDLDAPVVRYVPAFSMADPAYRRITVRMLLDHSAGLPGSEYRDWSMEKPFPGYVDQALAALRTQRLKTTPGAMSVYCNDCFTLAQLVVEGASGKPFADYVRSALLDPLGMTLSRYPTETFPAGVTARVYDPASGSLLPQEYVSLFGSGGLFSTPVEMARFATMLANGGVYQGRRVLSAASVAEMGRDQTKGSLDPVALQGFVYGLGWDTVKEPGLAKVGVTAWYKSGGANHYTAGLLVAPGEKLSVIVESAMPMAHTIDAESLAQRVAIHALAERGSIRGVPAALGATKLPRRTPTRAQLDTIAGTYLASARAFRVIPRADRTIRIERLDAGTWVPGVGGATLSLRSDGAFWTSGDPPSAVYAAQAWGRTYLVFRMRGGIGHYMTDVVIGEKVTAGLPLSDAWKARAGHAWVFANEDPASLAWTLGPSMPLIAIPDLPGYLMVDYYEAPAPVQVAGGDTVGAMFTVASTAVGRDLEDLVVEKRGAEEWLHWGGTVLRPADSIPRLATGSVGIGSEGYAEWRTTAAEMHVSIAGASAWKVLDADLTIDGAGSGDEADAAVPAGGYLVLFGDPGASIVVGAVQGSRAGAPRIAPVWRLRRMDTL